MARESRLWPVSQRLGWPRCSLRSSANHCGYLKHWRKQPWNIKGQGKQSELEPVVYLQDSGEWAVEGGPKKRRRGRASGREGREEKLKETSGSLKVKIWGHMFCYSLTIPSMHSMYLDYLYLHFCFPTPPTPTNRSPTFTSFPLPHTHKQVPYLYILFLSLFLLASFIGVFVLFCIE